MTITRVAQITIAAVCVAALPALQSTLVAADTWTPIAKFSGSGEKPEDTAPFTTHGIKMRFRYSVEPNSTGPVPILLKMYPKGSPADAHEVIRTQCIDCKGEHVYDAGIGRAGTYYIHVITSRPWTLVVEESK